MRQKPEIQTIRDTNKKLWIQQIMDTKKIMDNNKNMETKQLPVWISKIYNWYLKIYEDPKYIMTKNYGHPKVLIFFMQPCV